MSPYQTNEHLHSTDNWKVNRDTPFPKLVYITPEGKEKFYDKSDVGLPVDILNHFFRKPQATDADETSADNPLDEAPDIAPRVYDLLPPMHKRLCSLYDTPHEQHVFLCGLLPTIASLLSRIQAPHADGYYSTDFFLALVASAGQGKGTAAKAFDLALPVDEMLRNRSEQERLDYEAKKAALDKGESMNEPEPAEKCHIIPANASAIALIQSLHDNDGRAYLAETEIDSMLAADRNAEWGNVSSILRGAFHHETVSVKRKTAYRGKTTLTIKNPSLSVFLSGTPSQFQELMHSTENGLFSRFAVYYHNPPLTWRSHRPTAKSVGRADAIKMEAEILKTIYEALAQRSEAFLPVSVELSEQHWNLIDTTFSDLQSEFYHEEERPDLLPSARRGAIIAFRLAVQFAVIRYAESLEAFKALCKEENAVIVATDEDVDCALLLAKTFTSHAHKLSSLLPTATKIAGGLKPSVARFLELLPKAFSTHEALEMATQNGIAKRTAGRYLKSLTDSGSIIQISAGKYVVMPSMARGISGTNGISGTESMPTMPTMSSMPRANNGITNQNTKQQDYENDAINNNYNGLRVMGKQEAAILLSKIGTDAAPEFENTILPF